MPIVIALVLLWVGTLLDMASTYFMVVILSGEFREVNQNYLTASGDFQLANFWTINSVFLLVFSLATMFALRNRNTVRKYIRGTGYRAHIWRPYAFALKKYMREPEYGAHGKDGATSKRSLMKEDFVSRRVISSVSALVFVGSVGGARFLFFVNNLTEYYGYPGLISLFLWAFPAVHEQLALIIVFVIAAFIFQPIAYLLLRLAVR